MDGPRPAAAAEGPVRRQKASRSSSSGSSSSSEKDIFSTAVVISRQGDVVPAPQREQNSRHHTPHRQRVAVQSSTGTTSVIATVSSSRHAKREHGRKTFASSQLGGGSTIVRGPPLDPVTAHSSPTKPSAPSSPSWSNLNEKSPAGGSAGDLVGFSMVDAASSMTTSRATDDPESGLPSVAHHHHTKGSGHHHSHRHRGRHVPHHSPDEPPSHHSHADGDQHPLADWSAQTHEDGEASSKDTALANTHPRTDSSGGTIFAATPKDPAPIFLRKEDRKACILDDSSSMTDEAYVEHHKLHHVIANLSAALLKQRPEDHVAFSLEWLKRHARVTSAQKSRHQSTRSRRRAADDPDSGKKLEDVNATSIRRMRRRRVNGGDARGSSSRVVSAKSSQLPSRRHSFHVTESATGPSCYSIQEGSQCAPDRSFMFSLSAQPLENSSAPPTGSSGIGSPNTKSVPADMPPQLLSSPASSVATSLARQTTPTTSMGGGDLGATMTISADLSSLSSGAACTNSLPPTESPVGSRGKESLILPTPAIEVSTGELQVSLSSSKTSTIGILRTSAPVAGSDSVSGKPSPVKPVTTEGESGEGDEGEGEDDEWAGMAQFQPVISIDEMTKEVVDHRSFVSPNTSTGASRRPAGGGFAFPTQGPLLSNLVPPTAPASTSSLRPLANVRGATTNASSSQIAAVIVPSTNTTAGLATPNTSSPSFQSPAVAPRNTTFPTGVKPAANNRVSLNTMASTAAAAAEKSINTSIGAVRTSSASTISKGNNQSFLASLANPMSPTYSAGVNVSADLAGLSESLRAMTDVRGGLKVDGKSVLGRSGEENSGSPTGVPPSLRPDVSKSEASSSHAPASPPPVVTVTRSTTLDDRSIHLSTKDGVGATLEGGYRCPCAAAPTATPTPVKRTIVCDSTSSCLSAQVHADVVNRLYQMISELPPSKHAATTVFLEGLLATRSASAPESSLSSSNSTSGVAGVRREALHASTHNAAALLRAAGDATGDVDPDISGDEDADLQMWQPMVASPVHGNKTGHGAIGYDGGAPLVGIVSAGAKGGGDASHSPSVEAIVKDALSQSVLKTLPSTHRPDAGGHANLVNSPTTSTSMRLMPTTNPVTAREDCTPLHADPVVVTSVDALSGNRDPLSAATSEDASPQSVSKMETAVFEVASDGSAAAAKLARSTRDSPVVVGSPSPVEQSSDSEHELGMLSSATQEFDVKGESDLIPSGPPPKSPSQHQAARSQKHSSRRRRRRHSRSREATERVTHANGSSHNSFPVTLSAPSDDGEDWDEWQPTDRSNSEVPHDAGPLGSSYPSHAPTLLPLHSTMILSTTSANSSTMDLPQITCTTEALSDTEGAHVTGEDPSDFPLSLPVKRRSYSRGSTPVSPCADGETSSTRHKRRRRHNPNKSAMDDDLHSSPHRRVSHRISLPRGFSSLFYRSKGRGERRGSLLDAESPQTSFIQERGDSTIPLNVPNSKDSMDDGSMAENSPFQMLSAERRQRRDGEASPTSDSILHQFQKRVLHPNTAPVVIAISQFSTQEHLFVDEVVVLRRALRTIQPFSSMDDTLREMVMRSMTRRVCHLGELVSQQDGPPSVEVGVVVSGTLSVLRDGVVSGTITDGQCVGSTELSQSTECQETIRVEQGSAVLYMISHNYLETLLLLEKDVRRFFFLQYICRDGLLQRLPSSTKVHLADSFRVAQVSAGDSIVVQGATVDSFFFVLSGEATVTAPQHFLAQAESPPMGSEKSSTSHMGDHPVYSHSSILRTPSTSHTPPSLVTRDSLHHRTCGQTIGEVEMCFGYPSLLTIVATTDVVVARLSRLYFNMMVGPQGAEALRMAIACSSIYNHLDCIAPKELRLELLRKRRGAGQRRHSANATTRPGIGVLPNTILRQSASVSGLGALSSYGASDRTASSTRLNGGRGGPSSSRCRTLSPGVTLPPSKATEEMNAAASVTDLDRLSTAPHAHSVHRRSTLHRTIRASDMPGASHGALAATKNGGANIGWKHVSTEGEIVFSGSRNLYRFPAHALRTNNSIMIAVVVDGTIIRWNSIAQRVTGYAPFEVIGQSIFDLLSNEDHKTRMREVLATAKRYAGNWDDYIVEKLERQHIFSFRQNMDLYQVGLALSIIPSNSAASAEVVLLFGRAAKYRAASNYAADVARWLDDSLKPQLRHFQRSVAQLELNDWLVTPDDAMRLRGHLDACLAMVNQFSQFSLLNMETVNESWRPLRLPVLMQKFTVEACSLAQNANCTFYCNAEEVTPRKEIFMDVARVLSVLRMLVTDAIDSSTRDGGRSVAIELHVTSLRPGDTDSRASRGLTASTPAPSSPEPGSTEAFDLPGAVRKPTGFAAAADAPASPPLGPQPIVNPTTHAENVATVTQLEKEVNGTLRQITDLSLRRIRFEMRDNGPSIRDFANGTGPSSPDILVDGFTDTVVASLPPPAPLTSPVGSDSSAIMMPVGVASSKPTQPPARSQRGMNLAHVEQLVSSMGGTFYGFTRPEVDGNIIRMELPLLLVPGGSSAPIEESPEEDEEELNQTAGGPNKGRTFTVILADSNRMQQNQLCQVLWARQHAVVPVKSYKELRRKMEANTADILIVDPLQLIITAEDHAELQGVDPFDDIRDRSSRMVLVVLAGTDLTDWRIQKLLDRNAVIELPKQQGSGALVHIAMQEAERMVTEMREEEERIDLLRRAFSNSAAEGRHKIGRLLGRGAFGEVYEVEDTLTGGRLAMKRMKLKDGVLADTMVQEILAMTSLQHENIIHYFYCEKESDSQLRLYMELASGGTLRDTIRQRGGVGLPFDDIVHHLTDICRGLAYVHSQHYVHADLKSANLLLGTRGRTKIGDFGTAKRLRPREQLYAMAGTPQYMAPEVLNADADLMLGYDYKADIWSLGCIVMEMATGNPPFAHLDRTHGMGMIKYLSELTDAPDLSCLKTGNQLIYKFVKACLQVDPHQRPSAQDLLHLDILQGAVCSNRAECNVKRAAMLYTLNKYAAMREEGEPSAANSNDDDHFHGTDSYASESGSASTYESGSENGSSYTYDDEEVSESSADEKEEDEVHQQLRTRDSDFFSSSTSSVP